MFKKLSPILPSRVRCDRLHTPMSAATHYLQTRDAHFDLAAGLGEAAANPAKKSGNKSGNTSAPN